MGVLEDAIREHLELKRKHGASDEELLREESAALGPARQEPEPVAPAVTEAEKPAPEEPADAEAQPVQQEQDVQEEQPPEQDEAPATEPAAEPAVTQEESVLEETPDFLQETPEHDRLWFEQKPPRDFDFE